MYSSQSVKVAGCSLDIVAFYFLGLLRFFWSQLIQLYPRFRKTLEASSEMFNVKKKKIQDDSLFTLEKLSASIFVCLSIIHQHDFK